MNMYNLRNEALGEPPPGLLPGEHPAGTPEEAVVITETLEEALQLLDLEIDTEMPINWVVQSVRKVDAFRVGIISLSLAPVRPPALCANDLFKLPGIEDYCPVRDERCCETLKLGVDQSAFFEGSVFMDNVQIEKNERVKSRIVWDPYIDGRRCHTMATIWFDGNPIGVVQTAGREGGDFSQRFITDPEAYNAAVAYLRSLYLAEVSDFEVIDPSKPIRGLNDFYNNFAYPEVP